MKTRIKKIENALFIEIPDAIEKLYKLKETHRITINIVEKGNCLIINCALLDETWFKIIQLFGCCIC